MLAVKLHFKKRPFTGKGSYWIPVTTWKVAGDQIRRWLPILTASEGGTGKRQYITLAKIPDDHLVLLGTDWVGFETEFPTPLKDVPKRLKDEVMTWFDDKSQGNYWVGSYASFAQLRLEEPLPRRCIKWTKDLRLLRGGDKRRRAARTESGR